jgi:hypothetical protein
MNQFITQVIQPLVATLASILIPLIVAYAANRFRAWTGIEIEARHREALQSALANAARIVLASGRMIDGISYVNASVPDALKALKVTGDEHVEDLLAPHVARAKDGKAAA